MPSFGLLFLRMFWSKLIWESIPSALYKRHKSRCESLKWYSLENYLGINNGWNRLGQRPVFIRKVASTKCLLPKLTCIKNHLSMAKYHLIFPDNQHLPMPGLSRCQVSQPMWWRDNGSTKECYVVLLWSSAKRRRNKDEEIQSLDW